MTALAATVDDRIGAQLIADLDQAFARIAAGAQDGATAADAAATVPGGASGASAVPPLPRALAAAAPGRIEPELTAPPPAQPPNPAPDDLWAALPATADAPTTPSFMLAKKPRSWRVLGALAALAFVGIVFVLAEWGPVVGDGASPAPDQATMTAPGDTDRAPIADATTAAPPVTATPDRPVSTAAPTGATAAPTTTPEPSTTLQAPHDAAVPPGLPTTAAGPAQSSTALKPTAAEPAEPAAEPPAKAAPPRRAKVAATPKAKAPPGPASPREVCGNRTRFSLYQCMQTQCASSKWSAHAQCVRLRHSDSVD
ncbi:MAG: hypothetical protein ABIR94_08740 [Rubrivivax sp.]